MTTYKEFRVGGGKGPFGSFGPLIMMIVFFFVLYFVAKGLFTLLAYIAPLLLIGAAILDYKVFTDFFKFILKLLKENPLVGIIAIILTVVGFPIVSGYLFFKALMRNTINRKIQKKEAFDEYEDVTEDIAEEDFLDLPEMEKPEKSANSEYDDLFN